MNNVTRAAEIAARESYGRLLAYLAARTHDIAQAEDALAEAFSKALQHWPEKGVPGNPDAWLLTVARNNLTDRQRHLTKFPTTSEIPETFAEMTEEEKIPDRRLVLMMICAHPAISPDLHTPLMLQTVLGVNARTIARLFLFSPAALSKRLARAKNKIRDAGIPFCLPDKDQLPKRSHAILEAIYALHSYDWLDPRDNFGDEALYLSDLLCSYLPENAEALGLSSLILFSHARKKARILDEILVPTDKQDTDLWDTHTIKLAENRLQRAFQLSSPGRFQIEAAIDSVHISRKKTGQVDWRALHKLYHALIKFEPSAGALVAQAVVIANLFAPKEGLKILSVLEKQIGTSFQPLWAAKAELFARTGAVRDAKRSYEKAISLSTDATVIRFLVQQKSMLAP